MDGGPYSFRGTERFQLIRLIGHGGMGVVYEAFDTVNAASVALKLLPLVSPDSLLRFKREFRSVADIRHPNLVRLGELVAHEAQWFFTMELVDGVDLISYVRGRDAPPAAEVVAPVLLSAGPGASTAVGPATVADQPAAPVDGDNPRLRPAMAQLAQGLSALHEAGCVHRDVKPSNILIAQDGRGVLLDFGLASTASDETTMVGAGTPMYMAPEQAMPSPVTAAVDWYAFGVILFELLTGRLPFEGRPHEILYRKNHDRPPPVATLRPDASADLAQLCDHLLDPDPARRPGGAEVLACFAAPAAGPRTRAAPEGEVPLVGRAHELATLAAAFSDVRAGRGPRAVIVRGESGVGKSSLVRAFLEGPGTSTDALLLTARCYERELLPFKAVDGLVDALTRELRRLDAGTVAGLLPRRADMLLQAFPVLGRVPVFARARREPLALDPAEVRAAMFTAFRELMTAMGRRAPIVAFVDDLQWADLDSAALLGDLLAAREDAPRVLLLGTLRTVGGAEEPARLFSPETNEQNVLLTNLEPEAAQTLARDLLRAHGGPPSEQEAARLVQESAGHPLFLRELVRTARTSTEDGVPATLEGVLGARIGELPRAAIRLLRVLAIAGAPVALRLIRRAAELDGPETARLMDELRAARLVHTGLEAGDDVVVIAHDRVRQAVMGALTSAGEAKEVHERLAETFEDAGDVLGAGEHWREAGAPERAAVHFATAGRQAAAALAFDRAASHYNNALSMGVWTDEQRTELLISMADALSNAGRGPAAARHYLAAASRATGARALDLRRRAVEELLRAGNVDEGLIAAFTAVEAAGLAFAQAPLRALLWLRAVLRLRGLRFRRRAPDDIAAHDLARIDLCWSLSSGLGLTDHFQGAHFQARGLLLALRSGDLPRVARGIAGEAAYAAALGSHRRAARHLERAARLADETGNPHAVGIVSLMKGLSSHLNGRFALGLGHLTTAEQIFRERCVGTHWELAAVRQYSLECLYYLGELPRFESATTEGIKEAQDRGSLYAATTLRTGLTNAVWLLRDEPERARHELDEAMKPWSSHGYHVQHWYELIARTQIDLYTGAAAEAWQRMLRTWPALAGSGLLHLQHARIVALHLKARAAVAYAAVSGPEKDELLAVARRCARRVWREGDGWNRALASAAYAGTERVAGRAARADAWLNRALGRANTHGLAMLSAALEFACGDPRGVAWMGERGVRDPAALARMLLPGCVAGESSEGRQA